MGDFEYEKSYNKKKEWLREAHKKIKSSKKMQELYHKVMGTEEEAA